MKTIQKFLSNCGIDDNNNSSDNNNFVLNFKFACLEAAMVDYKNFVPPRFFFSQRYIAERAQDSNNLTVKLSLQSCKNDHEKYVDLELYYISMWLNDCLASHEPNVEILSSFCNYEKPEDHYGERETNYIE